MDPPANRASRTGRRPCRSREHPTRPCIAAGRRPWKQRRSPAGVGRNWHARRRLIYATTILAGDAEGLLFSDSGRLKGDSVHELPSTAPAAAVPDLVMKPRRIEIGAIRPADRAVDQSNLLENGCIAQRSVNSGVHRLAEPRTIRLALSSVVEVQRQPTSRQGLRGRHSPRRAGIQSRGSIRLGNCLPLLNFEWVFCGAERVKGGPRGMRPGAAHP